MMGVFAEFERSMIQERVKSGIERAKSEEADPQGSNEEGLSYRKIAERIGLSLGSVQNALKIARPLK